MPLKQDYCVPDNNIGDQVEWVEFSERSIEISGSLPPRKYIC